MTQSQFLIDWNSKFSFSKTACHRLKHIYTYVFSIFAELFFYEWSRKICRKAKIVFLLFKLMLTTAFKVQVVTHIRGSLNKFPDFFRMGTFIDSTHMKLKSPSKYSPPAAMHLYRSNNFWKAPWKSSCVSVSMTFVTASFIPSIVS